MGAPEKLYIGSDEIDLSRTSYIATILKVEKSDIEYTRTDAFIKKAEEYLYKMLNDGRMECGDMQKFIDEFRKYMEG